MGGMNQLDLGFWLSDMDKLWRVQDSFEFRLFVWERLGSLIQSLCLFIILRCVFESCESYDSKDISIEKPVMR